MDLGSIAIQVARSENLPVLPQIVTAVLKLADDPNASSRAMEQVIERDPAISAKILKVSNSMYYGGGNVASVGRAISVLGMNTVRSMVVSIAYQQMTSGRIQANNFSRSEFWFHSMASAAAARILGKIKDPVKAEALYTAGLMHDVGMLVLDRFVPEEFDAAIKLAAEQEMPLLAAEQSVLGFDHIAAGHLLVEKWGLRGVVADAMLHMSNPSLIPDEFNYVHVIVAADHVADRCGYRNHSNLESSLNMVTEDYISMPEGQFEIIIEVVRKEVERACDVFQVKAA